MQFQFHLSVVVVWSESIQSCEPVYVYYCASSIPIPIYRSINMKFTIIIGKVAQRYSCVPRCPQVPLVSPGASGITRCLWCPQVPLVSPGASGVPRFLWCPQCLWCHQVPLVSPSASGPVPQVPLVGTSLRCTYTTRLDDEMPKICCNSIC